MLKHIKILVLVLSPACLLGMEQSAGYRIALGDRPAAVQCISDAVFEKNKKPVNHWIFGGARSYYLLSLSDYKVIEKLAFNNPEKSELILLDVGCASGEWCLSVAEILTQHKICQKTGKQVHIYSLTGSQECREETFTYSPNITIHQYNNFKIEDIGKELLAKGIDLRDKVDLIVSRWTLRHLVDPFETLKQLYRLLTPSQGILMSNGFLFAFDDSSEIQHFPYLNWSILAASSAISLFHSTGLEDHFLLMRNSEELELPITYTGKVQKIDAVEWQSCCEFVTEFNSGTLFQGKQFFFEGSTLEDYLYDETGEPRKRFCYFCENDSQRSKELYAFLKIKT